MAVECPYRVVLADDHAMFRHALKRILAEKDDLEVVGEAGDGLELLALLNLIPSVPHMAIVDISMPNLGGIEVTTRIKGAYPGIKVLILTVHGDKEYVLGAMSAGAEGYLLKKDADRELFPAIEQIRQGGVYVSPVLLQCGKRLTT
jgi:DNA-binding NarL/FixJ family response regulator